MSGPLFLSFSLDGASFYASSPPRNIARFEFIETLRFIVGGYSIIEMHDYLLDFLGNFTKRKHNFLIKVFLEIREERENVQYSLVVTCDVCARD